VAQLYLQSRGGSIEKISVAQQWIYANYIENTSSSIVFTAPLHRNGSYPSDVCVFVVAGMCLPSSGLEMGLYVTIVNLGELLNEQIRALVQLLTYLRS
jgi:hypothetical protein